jgi:DNA-binding transcriptional MerR regulator
MDQLTLGEILKFVEQLKKAGMSLKDIKALPIYLGDDDELNGIHCGWYTNLIDYDEEDDANFIELINEDRCNIKLDGKAILIS